MKHAGLTANAWPIWSRGWRGVVAAVMLSVLAACGGGEGASAITTTEPITTTTEPIASYLSSAKIIDAVQAGLVGSTQIGGNTYLQISSSVNGALATIKQGDPIQIPPGIDVRYPLGLAAVAGGVTQAADGSKLVELKPAGLFDVFKSVKVDQQSIQLSADNYIGAIAPSIIRGTDTNAQPMQVGLIQKRISDLGGALTLRPSKLEFADGLMSGVSLISATDLKPGDIAFEKEIDLGELFKSEGTATGGTSYSKIGTSAESKLKISIKLSDLKLATVLDGEKVFDTLPYKINNYKFKLEGVMTGDAGFTGGATMSIGTFNQVWKEVEDDSFKKLGMNFKLSGLDSKDKVGKFPLAGLVFAPTCPNGVCPVTMGSTQTPIRAAKYGGVIVWIYWNLDGTISFEGQLGARTNAKFEAGFEGDTNTFNLINSVKTSSTDKNLIEAPYAKGTFDAKAKMGFSTDVDVFLGGIRFGNAAMFLGAQPSFNAEGQLALVKPEWNADWRWDANLCIKTSVGAGAIFSGAAKFAVDDFALSFEKKFPDASENLAVAGAHGLWYTFAGDAMCFPKPVINSIDVLCTANEIKFNVIGEKLPDDLKLASAGLCSEEPSTEVLAVDAGAKATVTCKTSSSAGRSFDYTLSSPKASNLAVVGRKGSCPAITATINATPINPTVLQAVSLWISNAYQTVKSVVWNFGAGIAEQTAAVTNSVSTAVSQAFSSAGSKIITATFRDAANAVLGTQTTTINVTAAAIPTVTITGATSDAATQPGSIANGGSTDDTTPTLSGTLSKALTSGQKVNVYDGVSMFAAVAVVNGTNWIFTPITPLIGGVHSFTADVSEFDGTPGARSAPYAVNVLSTGVTSVTPGDIIRTQTGSFDIVGRDLPTSGISVAVPGDAKASCQTPTNMSVSGFGVACVFYKLGDQTLEIRQGAKVLGTATVLVKTNVTGVTWTSPSTNNSGTIKFHEDVSFKVAGVNLLADSIMGFAVQLCGVSNVETGVGSNTQRTFTCNFNNDAGAVAGQMPGVIKDSPTGQVLFDGWNVPVETAVVSGSGKLTDTGITAAQCYQAGSDALVSCTSSGAIALNAQQDGMVGRDVSNPDNSDGKLGFSYSTVGSHANTECVKDNITGLTWEGKTADGSLRDGSKTYTNYGDGTSGDASAYVRAVNATGLCGYTDWRLPSRKELQSIIDYSFATNLTTVQLTIDTTWFLNTQYGEYWTSNKWLVQFVSGRIFGGGGNGLLHYVRLVR